MEDKLKHMFILQEKLQEKLGTWNKIESSADKQQFVNQQILALHEEAVEIMKESAYKNPEFVKFGWKKGQQWNEEKFKEEIVDIMHFVMNLSLVVGMDSDEFYERYCKKNNVNHERKDSGY